MKRSFCLELGVNEETVDELDKMLYDPTFNVFPDKFDFKISEKVSITNSGFLKLISIIFAGVYKIK